MKKIGLLSDTHSFLDEKVINSLSNCDEIWHVGDVGDKQVIEQLSSICTLRVVYGNIDGPEIRDLYPEVMRFVCEEVNIVMKHIGGYPKRYDKSIQRELVSNPPDLFISGHSHILKVMYDKSLGFLHMNPGAAGIQGFHKVRTILRFEISGKEIKNLELVEFPKQV